MKPEFSYIFEPLEGSRGNSEQFQLQALAAQDGLAEKQGWNSSIEPNREDARPQQDHHTQQRQGNPGRFACVARSPSWWWWEVVAAAISTACTILLAGLLKYLEGLPYSDWAYHLSPNTIIAVVMAIGRAAFLVPVTNCLSQLKWNQYHRDRRLYNLQVFDQASRGFLGAIEMLYAVRPGIASIGAMLVILSAAIDPLTQQMLSFPSRVVVALNETASAQKTQTYLAPGWNNAVKLVDISMDTVIMKSLYGANDELQPVCPTGNCMYPDFATLGMCSHCQDVTTQTTQQCKPYPPGSDTMLPQDSNWDQVWADCSYITPSGFNITPPIEFVSSTAEDLYLSRYPLISTAVTSFQNISSLPAAGIVQPILGMAVIKYLTDTLYTTHNLTAAETRPNITECALYFCEQQYENNFYTVSHPILEPSKTQQLFYNQTIDLGPDTSLEVLVSANGKKTFSSNSTYAFDTSTWAEIGDLFIDTFNIMLVNNTNGTQEYGDVGNIFSPATVLYVSPDLGQTMAQLATSMTTQIRTNSMATEVSGQALVTQTYIAVRWYWIVVPAVMVCLSIYFLVITILSTNELQGNVVLWKSSALALLACQLRELPKDDGGLSFSRGVGQMDRMAKTMYVSLDEDRSHPLCLVEH